MNSAAARGLRTHVLMYHDAVVGEADASGFPGSGAARFKLPWEGFTSHLDSIGRAVAAPPTVVDELRAAQREARSWSLTFDDGGASSLEIGEELARRAWRGHFFVVTSLIDARGFVERSDLRELRALGHVIGSHSASHPDRMSSLSEEELLEEWRTSVGALSELLDEHVRVASVPGGFYSRRVARAAAEAGIAELFTSEPVRTPHRIGSCLVVGRYSVRRDTSPEDAAGAAAGAAAPWLRQVAAWNARKPVKLVLGRRYEQVLARYSQRQGQAAQTNGRDGQR